MFEEIISDNLFKSGVFQKISLSLILKPINIVIGYNIKNSQYILMLLAVLLEEFLIAVIDLQIIMINGKQSL